MSDDKKILLADEPQTVTKVHRVNAQPAYEALRKLINEIFAQGEDGVGFAVMAALATLLGEVLSGVPAEMRVEIEGEAMMLMRRSMVVRGPDIIKATVGAGQTTH